MVAFLVHEYISTQRAPAIRVGRSGTRLKPKAEPAASTMNGAREKAMTAGCDDFETRPLMPAERVS